MCRYRCNSARSADSSHTHVSRTAGLRHSTENKKPNPSDSAFCFELGEGGFEPPKAVPADLQSVPFGHSGIPPYSVWFITQYPLRQAGDRSRTNNLLITNQLLCHWATPAFSLICSPRICSLWPVLSRTLLLYHTEILLSTPFSKKVEVFTIFL